MRCRCAEPVLPPHLFGVECQALNAAHKGPQLECRDAGGAVCRAGTPSTFVPLLECRDVEGPVCGATHWDVGGAYGAGAPPTLVWR